jgi:D-psicose/D-tagatose/L-ribulose 3-epimerase
MNKLAISNIAWEKQDEAEIFSILKKHNVSGIEIAPTKLWPNWEGATSEAAKNYAKMLANEGFTIPSLQALLFGKPELLVFGDANAQNALIQHISYVAELAAALGAKILVFGSPKNRDRGMLSKEDAFTQAITIFNRLGEECAKQDVILCIEPNPPQYGCNFITNVVEAIKLVKAVDSNGFGLHLDAAGMQLAGDDGAVEIGKAGALIKHFHASEPELGTFENPQVNHKALADALAKIQYSNWISIEMRTAADAKNAVATACAKVQSFYNIG